MFLIGRISFPSNAFYDSFTFHNPGLPGQSTFSAKADIAIVAASSLCGCRLMIRHFHWRDWGPSHHPRNGHQSGSSVDSAVTGDLNECLDQWFHCFQCLIFVEVVQGWKIRGRRLRR